MSEINRRQFLASMVAAGFAPDLLAMSVSITANEYLVSAQGKDKNGFGMTSVNKSRGTAQTVLTDFRGHGMAQNPVRPELLILFARRPGTVAVEINLLTDKETRSFKLAKNRNLQGHGCFSADGKLLFTAENDSTTGAGKIAVRDTQDYKQLGEMDSYGIGPHEIKLMPDGKTLVVANGGIHTRPESGRKKLNLATMQSNLSYIELATGNKLGSFQVAEAKASIRHLDVAQDGTVAFAMQLQREAVSHNNVVALAGIHQAGKAIKLFEQPAMVIERMNDYMGSVAINSKTRIAGFTSPKGDLAAFWNIDSAEFAGYHRLHDVCGLCVSPDQNHFIISSSIGQLRQLDATSLKENKAARLHFDNTYWDNHMMAVVV